MNPESSSLFSRQDPTGGDVPEKEKHEKLVTDLLQLRNNYELFTRKPWGIISINREETELYRPGRDECFIYVRNNTDVQTPISLSYILSRVRTIQPFKTSDVRYSQKGIFLISGANEHNISPHIEIFKQINISEADPNIPISSRPIKFHTTQNGRRICYFEPLLEEGWKTFDPAIYQQELVFLAENPVQIIDPQRMDGGSGLRLGLFDTRIYDYTGALNENPNNKEYVAGAVIY